MNQLRGRGAALFWVIFIGQAVTVLDIQSSGLGVKFGNLTQVQRSQLNNGTNQLYQDLQDYILQLQNEFVVILQKKIDQLSNYKKSSADELFSFFDEQIDGSSEQPAAIVGFRAWIHEKRDYTIKQYYELLQKIDPDFRYNSQLSLYERNFIRGVQDITNESIVLAQALILDLSSDVKTQRLSFDISQGFFESGLHAKMLYEEQLEKNQQSMNQSRWDNLKELGGDFCKLFVQHAGKIIVHAVVEQVKNIGSNQSSKESNISSGVIAQVANLSDNLKKDDIETLQENKCSDVSMILLRKAIRLKNSVTAPVSDVSVKTDISLSREEKLYLQNRQRKAQPILQKNFDINTPLRIAMCCSGGGNRAMIGTLGFFMAAAKHNVLQATTYMVGLSGSTWTIAPWAYLYSKGFLGGRDYLKSLEALKNNFIATLAGQGMLPLPNGAYTPPAIQGQAQIVFANQLMDRFGYEENISLVDLFGSLVGNYALNLSKNPFKLESCWSEIMGTIVNGDLPMPLCSTAFDARADVADFASKDVGSEYDWFESGPFEAGSTILGYIPIAYCGSPFVHGKLVKELICPEYPMSFYLGCYGSAFSLTMTDLIEKGLKNPTIDVLGSSITVPVVSWVKTLLAKKIDHTTLNKRHEKIHAQLHNFSYDQKEAVLKNKYIGLFDGGIAFNIPLPLVIDRKDRDVDVIFMYDSNPGDFNTLKSADSYFARKGIKMPSFAKGLKKSDLTEGDFPMRIYNDPRDSKSYDVTQPTFIYFPTKVDVKNPPFTTLNFKYTQNDINNLMHVVMDNFEYHLDTIKDVMQQVAKARFSDRQKQVPPQESQVEKKVDDKSHGSVSRENKKLKNSYQKGIAIQGINGEEGVYFSRTQSAYLVDSNGLKKEYTNVTEYSQAVTPPAYPLIRFAMMPNPKYKPSNKRVVGGQFEKITLYGQLEQQ